MAPRLKWLFDNGKLPTQLQGLSSVVKDDGNDAAHEGTLDAAAAEDLEEFTSMILAHIYTEAGKVKEAEKRRTARRQRTRSGKK